jgi:hypothetical protein
VVTTARVVLPAESLSGGTEVRDKGVTATEAVRLIRDGDSVVVDQEKDILAHIGFEPIIKVKRVRWTPGSSPTDSWALRTTC